MKMLVHSRAHHLISTLSLRRRVGLETLGACRGQFCMRKVQSYLQREWRYMVMENGSVLPAVIYCVVTPFLPCQWDLVLWGWLRPDCQVGLQIQREVPARSTGPRNFTPWDIGSYWGPGKCFGFGSPFQGRQNLEPHCILLPDCSWDLYPIPVPDGAALLLNSLP